MGRVRCAHSPTRWPTAFDRSFAVCAGNPSHARELGNKEEGKCDVHKERREVALGSNRLPAPADPPHPSRFCIISQRAGHRPCGILRLVCLVPLPEPPPYFPSFPTSSSSSSSNVVESVIARCCVSFFGASHHFPVFSCSPRHGARRPGARISSVSGSGVKYFAFS